MPSDSCDRSESSHRCVATRATSRTYDQSVLDRHVDRHTIAVSCVSCRFLTRSEVGDSAPDVQCRTWFSIAPASRPRNLALAPGFAGSDDCPGQARRQIIAPRRGWALGSALGDVTSGSGGASHCQRVSIHAPLAVALRRIWKGSSDAPPHRLRRRDRRRRPQRAGRGDHTRARRACDARDRGGGYDWWGMPLGGANAPRLHLGCLRGGASVRREHRLYAQHPPSRLRRRMDRVPGRAGASHR